jgi:hypothetical protein
LIGDDHPRDVRQALQQLAEESLRRLLVSPALHKNVEDILLLVHGSPEIVPFAMDGQKHLIQMPRVASSRTLTGAPLTLAAVERQHIVRVL